LYFKIEFEKSQVIISESNKIINVYTNVYIMTIFMYTQKFYLTNIIHNFSKPEYGSINFKINNKKEFVNYNLHKYFNQFS
jgi:hypothetical protein